jgi:ligand-binding sensor domain-containing protein
VYKYNGRIFTKLTDSISQPCTAITACENIVYAGYKNGVVAKLQGTMLIPLKFKNQGPQSTITSLKLLSEQVLLIATEDEGLYLSLDGYLIPFNKDKGLTDNYISDVVMEKQNILLATDNGVNILSMTNGKINVRTVNITNGLPDNIVTALGPVMTKKRCWVGTQQGGITMLDNISNKVISLRSDLPWTFGQVNDILPVNENEAWCVTDDGFLLELIINHGQLSITPYSFNAKIKKIIRDKTGNIWCATNKGLIMHTGLYARHIPVTDEFRLSNYTAAACDIENNLWITQNRELYKINIADRSKPEHITTLPAAITTLHAVPGKGIWIGTFGKGLYQYSPDRQLRPADIPSLKDAHILSVTHIQDKLWVASFNGVDELEMGIGGHITIITNRME